MTRIAHRRWGMGADPSPLIHFERRKIDSRFAAANFILRWFHFTDIYLQR
jgi:hypothetical protein